MADQPPLQSPNNPHFFQPLLPGFRTHLTIPVAFFSKHVQRINDQNMTAKLRSDASDKTWIVKIDGLKLTQGWGDFAAAHDLQIGDITVFRHEGDMVFHVTALGPSCCEIQYTPPHNINDDQTKIIGNSSRDKRMKKIPRKNVESSLDHSRFVAKISAWNLCSDQRYLPLSFARSNGLNRMSVKKIALLNQEAKSWKLDLKHYNGQTYLRRGWTSFCQENGIKAGDSFMLTLVRTGERPVLSLCPADEESAVDKNILETKERKYCSRYRASSSHSQSRFLTLTLTMKAFQTYKMILPKGFTQMNGIDKPGKIALLGQDRVKRVVDLFQDKGNGTMRFGKGWREFCVAQGVKIDETFVLELIREKEASPVLKFCTKLNYV